MPGESFLEGFGRFSEVSRIFFTGVSPSMVRWEVSYKGRSFQKKFDFLSDPKIREMSQIGQGGPPRHPKNQKKIGPKRALGPSLGPWALLALGPIRLVGPLAAYFPLVGMLFT